MISYEVIVQQIERLAVKASEAKTEQQTREQLAAIRALCDVALGDFVAPAIAKKQSTAASFVQHPTPLPISVTSNALPSQKLNEEDANGDSLFDF